MDLAQMKRPASSTSAAGNMTFFIIWVIARTGPLRERVLGCSRRA